VITWRLRPVAGYVREHPIRTGIILVGGVILGLASFLITQVWLTFDAVATESFDPARASLALGQRSEAEVAAAIRQFQDQQSRLGDEPIRTDLIPPDLESELLALRAAAARPRPYVNTSAIGVALPDDMFEAYLGVGSDASGSRADTIVLALAPNDGAAPILVSIPRDLYVQNPCTHGWSRINTGLGGCQGFASGTELIALMVEGYTGIPVDHVARVNFDGFASLVNALGGTSICTDYPARDPRSGLDLPGGCIWADGYTTLAWARSRHTESLIDGEWKIVAGSDFDRQRRQQDILFQLARSLANFDSLGSLGSRLEAVAGAVRLDAGWSFGDAVATAWRYRGIGREGVNRISVRVADLRTSAGELVLAPVVNFNELLASVYAAAAR
jgi:LCP family protein required for cell wall assembly